jgi:hypothetical protein
MDDLNSSSDNEGDREFETTQRSWLESQLEGDDASDNESYFPQDLSAMQAESERVVEDPCK